MRSKFQKRPKKDRQTERGYESADVHCRVIWHEL